MSASLLVPGKRETDEALMARAQRGDRDAFAAIYERHAAGVLGFYRARLPWRPDEAADLAGDLWLRCWARRGQYRPQPDATPEAWLYRIARNIWSDWCRRRGNREPPAGLPGGLVSPEPNPHEEVAAALVGVAVRAAVAALPPGQRAAVELRWFRGYPRAAAARKLGTTEDGIQQRHLRALRHLRAALAAYAPAAG